MIASRMSDSRTEREIWLWIHEYNRSIDENRGIAKPDFLRNFWEEENLTALARNVDGPVPGGNLMIPPKVSRLSASNVTCVGACMLSRTFFTSPRHRKLAWFSAFSGRSELTTKTR